MVDAWCASYGHEPEAVTLDIDDTLDVVHGAQQLSLFHARAGLGNLDRAISGVSA
jgi:hypothetical protein